MSKVDISMNITLNTMKMKHILFTAITSAGMMMSLAAQDVGSAAPDFTADLLGGGQFTLSDHSGKVVLIYFFGNGCPYCIAAGPSVNAIYTDHQENPGFVAVGLDTWNASSSAESVAGFASSAEVTFPLAIKAGAVATDYGTTYDRLAVVDQDGILQHKGTAAAANDIENTRTVIEGLLNTTSLGPGNAKNADIMIYPNPVAEKMRISMYAQNAGSVTIRMYDMAGNELSRQDFDHAAGTQEFSIDLSDRQEGIYLYRLFHEGRVSSGKIILRR